MQVSRANLLQSSLDQLECLPASELKKKIQIEYEGEEGLDRGGLTKEWFLLLLRECLQPQCGVFTAYETSSHLWFAADASPAALQRVR